MCKRNGLLLLMLLATPAIFAQRLPRLVLPQHYILTIAPDIEGERFHGEETIVLDVQVPTASITLNAAEITFRSVTVTAAGRTQTGTVTLDEKKEQATIAFERPLPVGRAELNIAWDGILNRQLRGFYTGVASGRKYLASQMESTDARRAFPSFDEPDMKATFQINVIAEEKHAVISNSPIESETAGPAAGKKTVRFATTPRLSTYHIALIVGDFECLSDSAAGVPLRICAQPSKVELGRFAMQATKDLIVAMNDYFAIPYPFAKLDQIALTDFAAGAMENPGAITYRERVLLVDEKTEAIDRQRRSIGTISHEIAHIWFGDMVTMRWWDDIWLNEGFASWFGNRMVERVRPQWTVSTADATAAGNPMTNDVLAATRPIRKSAETPDEIEQLFDGIAYGKTAGLLRMIESYVGTEKFRAGINLYLGRNAWANASSGDFSGAIDDATGGAVTEILNSYVSQAGVPLVRMRSRCEGNETVVDLEQSRFLLPGEGAAGAAAQLWSIPVCFDGQTCVVLRERTQSTRLPGCRTALFPNDDGHGYYVSALEPAAYTALAAARESLSPSERLAFMRDQWLLVRAGQRGIGDYLDMAGAFGRDPHVADEVLTNIAWTERYLAADASRAQLQALLRRQGQPLLKELGWTVLESDSPEQRRLRDKVIEVLGDQGGDVATVKRARDLTNRWLRDRKTLSPEVVEKVTKVAAIGGDAKLYDAFLRSYRATNDPNEKVRFLSLLSTFRDPALLRKTLQLSLTDEIRAQDIASVLGGVLANPAGRNLGYQFLQDNWPVLEQKIPFSHSGRVIGAMTSSTCDPAWADRVRQFVAAHPAPQAERSIRMALERVSNCAELQRLHQASLSEWLARQR